MKRNTKREKSASSGFTLVELLVVLVIIGVMAAIIMPNFVSGSDGARLRTAARGITQMARYARTMAVLYQTPMTLVIGSDGELSVESKGGVVTPAPAATPVASDIRAAAEGTSVDTPMEGGGSYILADAAASKRYEQIAFRVTLDESTLGIDEQDAELEQGERSDETGDELGEAAVVTRIPFESNGRCLPFVVRIFVGGDELGDSISVMVDRFGSAKIEGDAE